ncbi:MAG: multiheme c-type cytochrome [Kiloniellales bacterium]
MKRLVFAAWAFFLGAVVTLSLIDLLGDAPDAGADRGADLTEAVRTSFTGTARCIACHRGIHQAFRDTYHPQMLGPVTGINAELLERWGDLPDAAGNPVVFDENQPTGIDGVRSLVLADGTRLDGIAAVYVAHEGQRRFTARFLDAGGAVRHEQSVSPYHIGAKHRQALAVNLGDGAGTRLLKYQYSFDDGAYQHTWRDRNQARIYEENCIGCHVSGFELQAFEADRNQPLERLTADLGVSCESCHGPGSAHVAAPRARGLIVNPARLTTDQQVHLCGQCHIRGASAVHEGRQDSIDLRPGDNILEHFTPVPVEWGQGTSRVAADGKAAASRQQFMDHYLGTKANMTCTACHAMHDANAHGALLRGDLLQVCAQCHGETAYPDLAAVQEVMDGRRGWDDPAWQGWRTQHTFRLDQHRRVIGLPEADWPERGGWPWEGPDWKWDFGKGAE